MKLITALLLLTVSSVAQAAAWITENENGGFIVLTEELCEYKEWEKLYPYKAVVTRDKDVHFTDKDPNKIITGCYNIPKDKPPMAGMFPIVSIIVQDPFSKEIFKDEHPITVYDPIPEERI